MVIFTILSVYYVLLLLCFVHTPTGAHKYAAINNMKLKKPVVVHKPQRIQREDSLEIIEAPSVLQATNYIVLKYTCSKLKVVGVTAETSRINNKWTKVFQMLKKCDETKPSVIKKIHLTLPDGILFRPGRFNRKVDYADSIRLRVWMVEYNLYQRVKHDPYKFATERKTLKIEIKPAWHRPDKFTALGCPSWEHTVLVSVPYFHLFRCNAQPEIIEAITYPIIITGHRHGVFQTLPPFTEPDYIDDAQMQQKQGKFTISMWLYIKEYCPRAYLCSIVHRVTWEDRYLTPLLFVNPKGNLHVQIMKENGEADAALTIFTMPKNEWFRLTVAFNYNRWVATLQYKDKKKKHVETAFLHKDQPHFLDTEGLVVFGGNDMVPGFKGYIGQATLYRGKYISFTKIPYPSVYHPMFELGLSERTRKCAKYIEWVQNRIRIYEERLEKWHVKDTCPRDFRQWHAKPSAPPRCQVGGRVPREFRLVNQLIRSSVYEGDEPEMKELGKELYENASKIIESEGFQGIKQMVPLLKQASCYGNPAAMYMLSVILSKGIAYKADEIMAHSYLMYAAMEGHKPSLMALGNKHVNGLDGIPADMEKAYGYYKRTADMSKIDRDMHHDTDVVTEGVRLTDEAALKAQTDEDGDVFQWVKHQAHQGVLTAQRHMAALLFWGTQGIQRNVQAAVEYYRMGAQQGDPQAMFDYGLVLMKGQGTKKDVEEGLKHLDKAAKKGNHQAINTLGWHAQMKERNLVKAVEYWEKAYEMGNVDAAHNLGHMYFSGQYPGKQVDKVKAYYYFSHAATRGQFDSGVLMAYFHIRGTPAFDRNPNLAVDWARYISEQSPKIGLILRKAVKAYRNQDWATAMFYYFLAAETGTEIAVFNAGFLCEENHDGLTSFIEKECVYHYFNLSTLRNEHQVSSYALLKMGDYHWYGCQGRRDVDKAVMEYERAALKNDPQAIFNLALLVEEGVNISNTVWHHLKIPQTKQTEKYLLLNELYTRCKESSKSEAYIPCRLALFRVQMMEFWENYKLAVKMSSVLATLVFSMLSSAAIYTHVRGRVANTNTV